MEKRTKYLLAAGAAVAVGAWALTTKNEVIESMVFPLKVKLGLATRNSNKDSISAYQNEISEFRNVSGQQRIVRRQPAPRPSQAAMTYARITNKTYGDNVYSIPGSNVVYQKRVIFGTAEGSKGSLVTKYKSPPGEGIKNVNLELLKKNFELNQRIRNNFH